MLDFSVIIPVKNEEDNISACLDSIASNDYPPEKYEIIVVDNGSEDQTVNIALAYGVQVTSLPDVTISALRNHGAKLASGQVLAFMDADCTVAGDWLQQASRYLHQSDVSLFGSPPGIPQKSTWVQRTWLLVRGGVENDKTRQVNWIESMNMFVPRHLFFRVKGFNEELVTCEDVDISYRLAKYGKIIVDPRIKAIHHGEAKDLGEFFRKEKWRGKSNYAGLCAHGLCPAEIPSLVLPVYFLLMPVIFILIFAVTGVPVYLLFGFLLWQAPLSFITMLKTKDKSITLFERFRLWLLYNIYYAARSVAIFA